MIYVCEETDYLMHHGIKGQKWGERRFQNPDGTLTSEGKIRYNKYKELYGEKTANRLMRSLNKGKTEKQAMKKEYNRRRYGNPAAVASRMGGYIGGAVAGGAIANAVKGKQPLGTDFKTGLNVIGPKSSDIKLGQDIGAIVGVVLGGVGSVAISKLYDGYSNYDLSINGLYDFKKRIKEAEDK